MKTSYKFVLFGTKYLPKRLKILNFSRLITYLAVIPCHSPLYDNFD